MKIILIIVVLAVLWFFYSDQYEHYTCCDDSVIFSNFQFMNKKPFEHEDRYGNILDYEYNP